MLNPGPIIQQTLPQRDRMPSRRQGVTQEARIDGHKVYVRVGYYADGRIGEVFIDMAKIGSFSRGILHCFARLFSLALQYGVPLETLIASCRGVEFAPRGLIEGHQTIKSASSIVDYLVNHLDNDTGDEEERYAPDEL